LLGFLENLNLSFDVSIGSLLFKVFDDDTSHMEDFDILTVTEYLLPAKFSKYNCLDLYSNFSYFLTLFSLFLLLIF